MDTSDPKHPRNCWSTPQYLFDELNARFQFTLDACASPENAKCERFYTLEDDGLKQSWKNEVVFCNPPYGRGLIEPWVKKAFEEDEATSVLLLPVRTSTKWFHNYCCSKSRPVHVDFIRGRVKFIPPSSDIKASSPREDSMIVIFLRLAA